MCDIGPGLDTDVGTIDDVQTCQGHMAVEGELHYDQRCKYVRYNQTVDMVSGGSTVRGYTLRRVCYCNVQENQGIIRSEMHFSNRCKWKRIKDTALSSHNQNVYLFRKCSCYQPVTEYNATNQYYH